MVRLLQPRAGEIIQDPAAGTGGFLVAANRYIKDRTDDLFALKTAEQRFQRDEAFRGLELVSDTHRLLLMNLMLHGIGGDLVRGGDAMGPDGEALGTADLILTNPPSARRRAAAAWRGRISPSPSTPATSSLPSWSMWCARCAPAAVPASWCRITCCSLTAPGGSCEAG